MTVQFVQLWHVLKKNTVIFKIITYKSYTDWDLDYATGLRSHLAEHTCSCGTSWWPCWFWGWAGLPVPRWSSEMDRASAGRPSSTPPFPRELGPPAVSSAAAEGGAEGWCLGRTLTLSGHCLLAEHRWPSCGVASCMLWKHEQSVSVITAAAAVWY